MITQDNKTQESSYKIGDEILFSEMLLKTNSNNSSKQQSFKIVRDKFLGNNFTNKKPSLVGKIKVLCYKDVNPILSLGPDYLMSILLILVVIVVQIVQIIFTYSNISIILNIVGYAICFVFFVTFLITMLKNPGIPTRDFYLSQQTENAIKNQEKEEDYLICYTCNVYVNKDIKIGHCLTCNVCILGYDHHCGWSGKCIGQGNLNFFYSFLISGLIFIIYNIFLLIYSHI